jgi:hypothetical protein
MIVSCWHQQLKEGNSTCRSVWPALSCSGEADKDVGRQRIKGLTRGWSGEKTRWCCREKAACRFHKSMEVSGNRGTAREVRYVVERDAVQIEQGLAEQGLYPRVLDQRT